MKIAGCAILPERESRDISIYNPKEIWDPLFSIYIPLFVVPNLLPENWEGELNMEVEHMQRQLVEYRQSLFTEGWLDGQFLQLQQLQDENNPDFVFEVVSLYFEDSEKLLNDLTGSMDQHQNIVDFKRMDAYVHQFKGSSSSIGAERVKNACIALRNLCEDENVEACVSCLQQVKQEYFLLKNKLETLFTLEQQIVGAGGSVPTMEFSL